MDRNGNHKSQFAKPGATRFNAKRATRQLSGRPKVFWRSILKRISDFFRLRRIKQYLLAVILLLVVAAVSGCHTLGFYGQALKGQYQIIAHQESIEKMDADEKTPEALRQRFRLLRELRQFADQNLKLPLDGHYRKYVDVHRPYVVWNVEAAPEFSMQPKTWWYPLVGSLEYRGYFSEQKANRSEERRVGKECISWWA